MELRVSMIPDFVLVFCGVAPRAYHFHILDTAIVLAPWTLAMSSATSGSNTQFVGCIAANGTMPAVQPKRDV